MITLSVGIAAGFGACLRLGMMDLFNSHHFFSNVSFPVVTFLINIIGSALLGFAFFSLPPNDLTTIISVGLIGGYTTFSTFCNELLLLWKEHKIVCIIYGTMTYIFGLTVVVMMIH